MSVRSNAEIKKTVKAIVELLPEDSSQAVSEVMTAAGIVAVSAGLDDVQIVDGIKGAVKKLRELGVGEGRH